MQARIYQPSRSAMQSGTANTMSWILEFVPSSARKLDPLMGWTSSSDTRSQVQIAFDTQEAAVAYAKENDLAYQVLASNKRRIIKRRRGYAENFAYERRETWTH